MITILEAQQLHGLDIDPIIRVEVGDQKKYTAIKQCTSNPYFNEVSFTCRVSSLYDVCDF